MEINPTSPAPPEIGERLFDETFIPIPTSLSEFIEAAVVRAGYLYPDAQISICDSGIRIEGQSSVQLRRDLLHLVYREKIYAESRQARELLLKMLSRP